MQGFFSKISSGTKNWSILYFPKIQKVLNQLVKEDLNQQKMARDIDFPKSEIFGFWGSI
jgi:hypothetical protein